jgi:2-polyprenyl-3-methyl-5-hydroxy-6-metoxy-1,4-benzoquinol methylase
MDIETYAERHPQLPSENVEPHLLEWLARADFETLLDVGCGSGRLLSALKSKGLLGQARVRGVDLSQTNIERFHARMPAVEVAVDDAQTLRTLPDEAVDCVVSTQVLEHVDDSRMLAAISRVLTPNGSAYVSTVFKRPWARFIWRTERGDWALDPTHIREYTDDAQLLRLLGPAGLMLVDSQKVPVSFPLLDFLVRRFRLDQERVFASRAGRLARRVKVRIPGYYIWSLIMQRAV